MNDEEWDKEMITDEQLNYFNDLMLGNTNMGFDTWKLTMEVHDID